MAVGRNQPCPCDSGKKYKLCCLVPDDSPPVWPPPRHWDQDWAEDDQLDQLTNSVMGLLRRGEVVQAEAACQELREKYPDYIDWLDRTAMVLEAKGDLEESAEFWRKAAEYAATHDGFDPEGVDDYRENAERVEAELRGEAVTLPYWRQREPEANRH